MLVSCNSLNIHETWLNVIRSYLLFTSLLIVAFRKPVFSANSVCVIFLSCNISPSLTFISRLFVKSFHPFVEFTLIVSSSYQLKKLTFAFNLFLHFIVTNHAIETFYLPVVNILISFVDISTQLIHILRILVKCSCRLYIHV